MNADAVTDTQLNTVVTRVTGRWRLEEDAKLTYAVVNTSKKRCGKEYKTDWVAISALVPGRTKNQCLKRWYDVLDPSIGRANGRTGQWLEYKDTKLKDAVQRHGDSGWVAISALVPGRTRIQCRHRWNDVLDPNIDGASGRTGKWTAVEDIKLKDAVQTRGDKEWVAVASMVTDRTRVQCYNRWHKILKPNIGRASARKGKWTAVEDSKLKDAVQLHGGKNWVAITALVPGRTKNQCHNRWYHFLDCSTSPANGRAGTVLAAPVDPVTDVASLPNDGASRAHRCVWAPEEDAKLIDAVDNLDEDWVAV
jgi:hypothetical protein